MANSIVFLGVCDRLQLISQPHPFLPKLDMIGFKNTLFYSVFPCNLNGMMLIFSIQILDEIPLRISGVFPNNQECFSLNIDLVSQIAMNKIQEDSQKNVNQLSGFFCPDNPLIWTPYHIKMPDGVTIFEPTTITVYAESKNCKKPIGQLNIMYVEPLPFSLDRIDAIRSNPNAFKSVRLECKCTKCGDFIHIYTGLEQSHSEEKEGWLWYQNAPEKFLCKCKTTNINLFYIRKNMYSLLDSLPTTDDKLEFHRLYERDALEKINQEYWKLLGSAPGEEKIQQFLENYPILLESFNPARIFHKSPIMSKYKTDFTIISNNGNLYLIEIERPNIKLIKKVGGKASDLEHAISQVKDWLYEFEQHKLACLDCLSVDKNEVNKICGVVIAGRDGDYSQDLLLKLKWDDFGNNIKFLTYDDLGRDFDSLLRHFQQL